MSNEERAKFLQQAAVLVFNVATSLNMQASFCEHCGLNKRENWGEAQANAELIAVERKLKKFARIFAEGRITK